MIHNSRARKIVNAETVVGLKKSPATSIFITYNENMHWNIYKSILLTALNSGAFLSMHIWCFQSVKNAEQRKIFYHNLAYSFTDRSCIKLGENQVVAYTLSHHYLKFRIISVLFTITMRLYAIWGVTLLGCSKVDNESSFKTIGAQKWAADLLDFAHLTKALGPTLFIIKNCISMEDISTSHADKSRCLFLDMWLCFTNWHLILNRERPFTSSKSETAYFSGIPGESPAFKVTGLASQDCKARCTWWIDALTKLLLAVWNR